MRQPVSKPDFLICGRTLFAPTQINEEQQNCSGAHYVPLLQHKLNLTFSTE